MSDIPYQGNAGLRIYSQEGTETGKKFSDFRYKMFSDIFAKSNDMNAVIATITDRVPEYERRTSDARLLIASATLACLTNWQALWNEEGYSDWIPLYVIGPKSFHDAINRISYGDAHNSFDYDYRAMNFGANNYPIVDKVDGRLVTADELCSQDIEGWKAQQESLALQGISASRFTELVTKFC